MQRSVHRRRLAVCLAVAASGPLARAADNHYITAGAGNWQDPAKWSLGAPSSSDTNDYLDWPAGNAVLISGTTTSSFPSTLSINNLFVDGPSVLTVDSTASAAVPLNIPGKFVVDTGGTVNLSGGSLDAGTIQLGSTNGSGTMIVGGTASVSVSGGLGSSDLLVTGGTITIGTTPPAGEDPELYQAMVGGYLRNGAVNVSAGVVSTPYLKLGITSGFTGTYTQTGGFTIIGTALCVGCDTNQSSGSGVGTVTISSGSTDAASLLVGSNAGGTGSVAITGPGLLAVSGPTTVLNGSSVSISGGGRMILTPHGAISAATYTADTISSLNVSSGTLDITNHAIDLPFVAGSVGNPSLAAITALVAHGFSGGTWSGTGITSSYAAGNSLHLTAIAVILNNDGNGNPIYTPSLMNPPDPKKLGLFVGTHAELNDVLVATTYFGDANLDGKVDGSDYSLIDNGYAKHLTGWFNGDFNYDGVVDGSDYALMDNAYNNQGASLGPSAQVATATAQVAAVPEPVGFAAMMVPLLSIAARRRRNF